MSAGDLIRLLLVDDALDFLEVTARALSRRGFAVTTAEDGSSALELLRGHAFDLLVLDVRLPDLDGPEVFRRARQIAPELPVVMLTGHGTVKQAFEISRAGVFEYLTKPCDVDKLAKVARRAVATTRGGSFIPGGAAVRVLVVDDDPDFCEALAIALRYRGFVVVARTSGAAALEVAAGEPFDVAVVDLHMPQMDGIEVLKRLKAAQPCTEVLMLTGQPSVRHAVEGMSDGAFDFLVKPPSVEALVQQLRRASAAARARAQTHTESG